MDKDTDPKRIAALAGRLKKLYTAAVYDILDEMGMPNQCLDLAIKPLDRTMRIAGPAFTIAHAQDARKDDEYDIQEVKDLSFFRRVYPGAVVVMACAGAPSAGHWGELLSTAAKARGATGVIVDGGVRDGNLILDIPDWTVFARYLSPIESRGRSRIRAIEQPVAVGGSLTTQVRVVPGDWIFGDMDGVICIPASMVEEVVRKAEDVEEVETKVRDDVRAGMDVKAVFAKYGRM